MTHQTKTERLTDRQTYRRNTPTGMITVNHNPLLLLSLCILTNNRNTSSIIVKVNWRSCFEYRQWLLNILTIIVMQMNDVFDNDQFIVGPFNWRYYMNLTRYIDYPDEYFLQVNPCQMLQSYLWWHLHCWLDDKNQGHSVYVCTGWAKKLDHFWMMITLRQLVVEKRVICQKFANFV